MKQEATLALGPLVQRKRALVNAHRKERLVFNAKQATRWEEETRARTQPLPQGLKGIWFRLTGKHQEIKTQNERETESCRRRDRDEKQSLIN